MLLSNNMPVYRFHPMVLVYWTVAFAIWEWLFVTVSPKLFASVTTYQEYYRKMPSWVPVAGDYLYSTLIFLSAQWVYLWMAPRFTNVPPLALFVLIFIGLQWIYDLTWATIVMTLPSTTSRYIEFFQRYIREAGFNAAIGDSVYLLAWLAITWVLLRYAPLSVALYILVAALFVWLVAVVRF